MMEWWMWASLGVLLLIGEIALPGNLFLAFFGVGAFLVSALVATGLFNDSATQWLLFAIFSVSFLLLFRKKLLHYLHTSPKPAELGELAGETGTAKVDIAPQGTGNIELRGTKWSAKNVSDAVIPAGARCRVEKAEGLTVFITKI